MARLLLCCAAILGLACAVWPHWSQVPPRDSGLVGEWIGQPEWSDGDTIVWQFDSAGTATRSRIRRRPEHNGLQVSEETESLGRWRVYDDSAHSGRRFVCFDYGRERARLPCWYFTIAPTVGQDRRELRLLGRVGGPAQSPEVFTLHS